MEFNFNGASAEESKNGTSVNLNLSAFGDSNEQNVKNLKARVCGTEGNLEDREHGPPFTKSELKEGCDSTYCYCGSYRRCGWSQSPYKESN